jgi:hypothetical protein
MAIIDSGKTFPSPALDESLVFFILAVGGVLLLLFHPPFPKNLYLKGSGVSPEQLLLLLLLAAAGGARDKRPE